MRRELSLRDVTLFAIACLVAPRWISAAARAGPGSLFLWLVGAIFFVAPLAIAVAALTVKYPGAGGLYLWTRRDFGPWHGFLAFWIYWMGIVFWFPSTAMFYTSAAVYSLGSGYSSLADHRVFLVISSLAVIWLALGTNLIGLRIGKWTENLGAASSWILGGLIVGVAILVWQRRGAATPFDVLPRRNWETVSLGATIAYAMTGMELVGMMGAEIQDPRRTLPRAAGIASIFCVAFYAAATFALLVLLPPGRIHERYGLTQGAREAATVLSAPWLTPLIGVLVLICAMGLMGGVVSGTSRLPFAAGADRLLPAAFSKVHPRWGTPHVSLLTLGTLASVMLVAIQLGDTLEAAYRELFSLMVIAGFLPYIYIFASAWKAGNRVSAASGMAITILAMMCAAIPTSDITNVAIFEAKLAGGTLAVVGSAWLLYRRAV